MTFRELIESNNYKNHTEKELKMLLRHHEDDLQELENEGGDTKHTIRDIARIKKVLDELKWLYDTIQSLNIKR